MLHRATFDSGQHAATQLAKKADKKTTAKAAKTAGADTVTCTVPQLE